MSWKCSGAPGREIPFASNTLAASAAPPLPTTLGIESPPAKKRTLQDVADTSFHKSVRTTKQAFEWLAAICNR